MTGASLPGLPPRPIPIKDRSSIVFVERGQIDVLDGAFVVVDVKGVRTHIPVGGFACLMLEPGTRVSHAAVALAARAGTLLVWVGEAGVRLYASGQPGGARADRLLWQARLGLDEAARLRVVRRMFELRFGEPAPERRSVDQLRDVEGVRVRKVYEHLARNRRRPTRPCIATCVPRARRDELARPAAGILFSPPQIVGRGACYMLARLSIDRRPRF